MPRCTVVAVSGASKAQRPDEGAESEGQLRAELESSRVEGRSHLAEVGRAQVSADSSIHVALELRMVPNVEGIGTELERAAARFADDEILEQGHIPVVTSRSTNRTVLQAPPSAVDRSCKGCRVEPLSNRVRVIKGTDDVRTVDAVRNHAADTRTVERHVEWRSGHDVNDTGELPSTHNCPYKAAGRIAEERHVVDPVDVGYVGAIKVRRPDVVPPTGVRIGDVRQVACAVAGVKTVDRP